MTTQISIVQEIAETIHNSLIHIVSTTGKDPNKDLDQFLLECRTILYKIKDCYGEDMKLFYKDMGVEHADEDEIFFNIVMDMLQINN